MNLIILISSLVVAGALGALFVGSKDRQIEKISQKKTEILSNSAKQAQEMLQESKSHYEKNLQSIEEMASHRKEKLKKISEITDHKSEILRKREEKNDNLKMNLQEEETTVRKMRESMRGMETQTISKLVEKTNLTQEQARQQLLSESEHQIKAEKSHFIQKFEEETEQNAVRTAQNILSEVIQRYSGQSSVEKRSGNVSLRRAEKKGDLIGKNGKNISYFESLLDVDVLFNLDSSLEITVSAFDLVQKNIAKTALESLIKERGPLNEPLIKQHVDAAGQKTDQIIEQYGQNAIKDLGLGSIMHKIGFQQIPTELIKIVGRLEFRTSFGQNIMMHSLEVGAFSALLAAEIGANVEAAYLAGFFHDIGKAIDQNIEESHDVLTKQILEKFNFPADIVHAAWAHHDGEPARTPEAQIIKAADAISAGRPGARQDSLAKHLERIEGLQNIGYSFEGIKKAYAISGGRELRIIVDENKILDAQMTNIAHNAACQIQDKLTYPGKIKVNVIRRTTCQTHAGEKEKAGVPAQ